ncbi:MAG: hypothetical protein R3E97_19920 [Candidatus Eisenbacteria bacterium]
MKRPAVIGTLAGVYVAAGIFFLLVFGFEVRISSGVFEVDSPSRLPGLAIALVKPCLAFLGAAAILRGGPRAWWVAVLLPVYLMAPHLHAMVLAPHRAAQYGPPRQGLSSYYGQRIAFSLLYGLPIPILLRRRVRGYFGLDQSPRFLTAGIVVLAVALVLVWSGVARL